MHTADLSEPEPASVPRGDGQCREESRRGGTLDKGEIESKVTQDEIPFPDGSIDTKMCIWDDHRRASGVAAAFPADCVSLSACQNADAENIGGVVTPTSPAVRVRASPAGGVATPASPAVRVRANTPDPMTKNDPWKQPRNPVSGQNARPTALTRPGAAPQGESSGSGAEFFPTEFGETRSITGDIREENRILDEKRVQLESKKPHNFDGKTGKCCGI